MEAVRGWVWILSEIAHYQTYGTSNIPPQKELLNKYTLIKFVRNVSAREHKNVFILRAKSTAPVHFK